MTVEIICVGTEILLGNIVNTNAAYLAEKLAGIGVSCYRQIAIGDNEERLEDAIKTSLSRSDGLILCGGLGPTKDDITKEVAAKVFGEKLILNEHTKDRIRCYFLTLRGPDVTPNNWKQAMVPEHGKVIDNHNGTAPGILFEKDGKFAFLLPGPPNELKPMFERDVEPYLRSLSPEGLYSSMLKVLSVGESRAESMIEDLIAAQRNPTIAPYAKTGEVHLRVTAKAKSSEEASALMEPVLEELRARFGSNIYTEDENVTLEESIIALLKEKKMTLATAESCTGGLLSGRIINASGASDVFAEGFITYSNEAKMNTLQVRQETIEKYGAVSEETAREMAIGAANAAGTDVALSVTGIAGPNGGTEEKPVGLTYIGCCVAGTVVVKEFHFSGDRRKNRDYAVVKALTLLREEVLKESV
ncbi:MAG: competence/damage-inducible protein A [Lachnospiraceae bacterium]|jgi:nicotinamide-nucleotide amidase|nr:competence/damage-inducible protein A [Lachnospiraceae bacterium]